MFDIPIDELASYLEREHRYKAMRVDAWAHEAAVEGAAARSPKAVPCWTVVEQTDEEYAATMGAEEWQERIGQYYDTGPVWGRPDIRPMRSYLSSCIQAAWKLGGEEWLKSMLDDTILTDGSTSIRSYVEQHPDRFADLYHLLQAGRVTAGDSTSSMQLVAMSDEAVIVGC